MPHSSHGGGSRIRPVSRRTLLRSAGAMAVAGSLTLLAACGGSAAPEGPATPNVIQAGAAPSYYPADYSQIIEASKAEGGTLSIYSNTDQENWAPIFRDFQKKYDWVKNIEANNLDSDEVFQKALSEQATNKFTADLLVSNAAQAWAEYAERPGTLTEYTSPELDKLPDFATLLPNVYAMSADPMTVGFNTSLMEEKPTGIQSLADIVSKDPAKFKDKITTRDISGAFGFTVAYNFVQSNPGAWPALEKVLPQARAESSSGTQLEKLVSGEYVAGFFVSAAPAYPIVANSGGLLEVKFPEDGTVVLPRGIGIAPKAPHLNTAKLFTDFLLSEEGQRALAEGGLTSYRETVTAGQGLHTYQEVVDAVGQDKTFLAKYDKIPEADVKAFTERWNGLLGTQAAN
jgi:iron(III) transport system substrate-binding protein